MACGPAPPLGPLLLLALWGSAVWGSSAPAPLLRRLAEHIQRSREGSGPRAVPPPKQGWLQQPLDPFNTSDPRSFLQVRPGRAGGEGAGGGGIAAFFSVSRISRMSPPLFTGHPAALAPAWGALVIGLEHRFYGLSMPAGGLDMAQLRFLSSRHALADVASARLALGRLFNVSSSSLWICFGGSYAGSLAAWARLKFPHLIFASVASSAPVRAVLDFSEYNQVRAAGGGRRVLAAGGPRYLLPRSLHRWGGFGDAEQREGAGLMRGGARRGRPYLEGEAPRGAGPRGDGPIRRASSARGGAAGDNPVVMHSLGQRCLSFSRAETVAQLKVTESQVSGVGDRQWLYQTCTEFGFYVTCEDPSCPFSQLPTLPSQLELCEQVFGLSSSSVAQAVAQTNSYYGGQTPGATRVLFVNGDTDPWHALSVTAASGPSEPSESALLIPGASHCVDMAPETSSDSSNLRLGRQSILRRLQTWLGLAQRSQTTGGS
ncbi:TSSP protease, partial [Crocuta crocuta]